MTTVAYLGNFEPDHSTENEVRKALDSLNVSVIPLQENDLDVWADLPARVGDADFLLWTRTWNDHLDLKATALDAVAAKGLPIVGFHLDRWWGLARVEQIKTHPFFTHTDMMFTADGGHEGEWEAVGIEHHWSQPAISEFEIGLRDPNPRRWPEPIVFVGSWQRYHPEWGWRMLMVNMLRQRHRTDGMFGIYPSGPHPIRGRDLSELYATAEVVVGDSCLAGDAGFYWSDRIPETIGRGGILVHPEVAGLADSYDLNAGYLWTYERENLESLLVTIDRARAMDPERRLFARLAGVDHVARHHTYTHRMEALLGRVLGSVSKGRRRVSMRGVRAVFEPRPDTTDEAVIREMWSENTYRLEPWMVEGGVVVDIGANIGAVTIWALKAGAVVVVACEPEEDNRKRLVHHLELNDLTRSVILEQSPVGSSHFERVWLSGSGGGVQATPDEDGVLSVSLDDVLNLAGEDVALLKVDVEGSEWRIFDDEAFDTLKRVRRMVMEFHAPPVAPYDTSFLMDRFGALVAQLAERGKVEVLGRPTTGGLIWWERYS